ncbi:polyprenyl synthetase family protein [Streptomyces sp. AK02-01A]|uniref:polyprenyl synthetase family protein n=1 Tax=Streptomyces sp. AK02-01A TaxID=3028648 RepID=UPI0029A5B435|nr:polyprenyl synthetase family protein [Streptomyces sp. AK02-01A]MDX3852383.1 polyprenyl synthetase family protein [Streptomyces sp. AK02-01A]
MRPTGLEELASTGRRPDAHRGPEPSPCGAEAAGPALLEPASSPDGAGPHACRPEAVDTDVPAAVGRVLGQVLDDALAESRAADPAFALDLAERLALFTLQGGKRMRSQFLWWGLRACAPEMDATDAYRALRLAAGLELIQTCALVHDDVMDGSLVRRGRPAVHAALAEQYGVFPASDAEHFGKAAAVLVGDLALAWADDVVADTELPVAGRRQVRAIWRAMRTEMVAGQYLDLRGQVTRSRSTSQALRTACLKTALYSVERPLALGAALAGADEHTTLALRSAGRCAGIAFQLRDDLLGVFGAPHRTGKPSGEDIREGKLTYLVSFARARAESNGDAASLAVLENALGDASLSEEGLDRVRHVLDATGARAVVENKIDRLVTRATRHLAAASVEPVAGRRLHGLLSAVAGDHAALLKDGPSV